MLEPGDVFKLGSTLFRVSNVENGLIYYYRHYPEYIRCFTSGKASTMGANSQERIILITNKTKQNEHQNRSGNFSKS